MRYYLVLKIEMTLLTVFHFNIFALIVKNNYASVIFPFDCEIIFILVFFGLEQIIKSIEYCQNTNLLSSYYLKSKYSMSIVV
jgi:hypothetical protein